MAGVKINMDTVLLSTDLDNPDSIPYFLWDEPMTVAEFKSRLGTASMAEQVRLLAKLMREARDTDVWKFISLADVLKQWPMVVGQLGRRRSFWEFLLDRWRQEGLIGH